MSSIFVFSGQPNLATANAAGADMNDAANKWLAGTYTNKQIPH